MTETQQEIQTRIIEYMQDNPELSYMKVLGTFFSLPNSEYYLSDEECLEKIKKRSCFFGKITRRITK